MGKLDRQEVVDRVGIDAVLRVEVSDLHPTNRSTKGTSHAGFKEYGASIGVEGHGILSMHVYISEKELQAITNPDQLDWGKAIEAATFELEPLPVN